MSIWKPALVALSVAMLASCQTQDAETIPPTVSTVTSDGIQIYGERYFGDLGANAPLILLFHQGGSNGRGEYAGLADWLNAEGYRAIAWDQRRGGETYGSENRTLAGLEADAAYGYCDAAPDLQAAISYTVQQGIADKMVIWGSSYSGALVFQAAAANPDTVAGVIAFSPASGGPLADCRAQLSVDDVAAPKFVLRPASEMANPSTQAQRDALMAAGVDFLVVENGVHGSSMLVDDRTEQDMSAAREAVRSWLDGLEPF